MIRKSLILFLGALIGIYAVLPHLGRRVPEFLVYVLIAAIATAVGTYLLPRTQLKVGSAMRDAGLAAGIGIVTAVVLVVLGRLLIGSQSPSPPIWTGVLYAFYGGLTEEVVFHFGLLTAVAWLALKIAPETVRAYWSAIAISAIAVGLSHSTTTDASILTAIGAYVTGWLYWRRGLEAAMIAHGGIGFALHVWAPGVFVVA